MFPPTRDPTAVMSASEWQAGANKESNKIDMREFFKGKSVSKPKGLPGASAPKLVSKLAPKPAPAPVAAAPAPEPEPAPAPVAAAPKPAAPKAAAAPVPATAVTEMPKTLKGLREAFTAHQAEIAALRARVGITAAPWISGFSLCFLRALLSD